MTKVVTVTQSFLESISTRIKDIDWIGILFMIISIISRLLVGAITLTVLAHFAPELREQLPTFYQLVDFLLQTFEAMTRYIVVEIYHHIPY